MSRPILAIEFDSVLHSFTTPYSEPGIIPDPPVSGAVAFVEEAQAYFKIVLTSPRLGTEAGVEAVTAWLEEYHFPPLQLWLFAYPPPAFLTLSARALTFTGTFPASPKRLLGFRPWNRKGGNYAVNPTRDLLKRLFDAAMLHNQINRFEVGADESVPELDEALLAEVQQHLRETT